MDAVEQALAALNADPHLVGRIVHVEREPGSAPRYAHSDALSPTVAEGLADAGIGRLYTHQCEAVAQVAAGRSVVVSTATASGKSICYLAPIMQRCGLGDATALLIVPTKALGRDQVRAIAALAFDGMRVAAIDGDCGPDERRYAQKRANVVITNPDMLHRSILPNRRRWNGFLKRLEIVVLDEVHTLRGGFGTHVAHVVRRLRRVCLAASGREAVFVCTTACLGDPVAHAREVCGVDFVGVTDDGSPQPPRTIALWNPPLINSESGIRMSPIADAGDAMARLVELGLQTLTFAPSRNGVEMVARIAREATESDDASHSVVAYRGGYLAEERRDLEERLRTGEIRGMAATNALELGIDIGGLDAVICAGFPGTRASFRQQIGRAGRSGSPAFGILIAGPDQLDQWYLANPDALFRGDPERAVINVGNHSISSPHLACAAYELALNDAEPALGGDMDERAADLLAAGLLRMRRGRLYWSGGDCPARSVDIRGGCGKSYRIVDADSGRRIGDVDAERAFATIHAGAVYVHQGETYVVDELDIGRRLAHAAKVDVDYYTQPRTTSDITITGVDDKFDLAAGAIVQLGSVEVERSVVGFRRRLFHAGETIGSERLDMPRRRFETRAFWYVIPESLMDDIGIGPKRVAGVVHACEHAGIGVLPRFAICDRWDVGGVSMAVHPDTGSPTWFVYDAVAGGAGVADAAFATGVDHCVATLEAIARCPCSAACPSCVQSPKCGNWNEPLDKQGAETLLAAIAPVGA